MSIYDPYYPEIHGHPEIIAELKSKLVEGSLEPSDPLIINPILEYVRRVDREWQHDWREHSPLRGWVFHNHCICPLCAIRESIRDLLKDEREHIPEREFRRLYRSANTCTTGAKARVIVKRLVRQQLEREWGRNRPTVRIFRKVVRP